MTAAAPEVGRLRALFRVFVGPRGGHHYVALRGPAGAETAGGHSVELRRGLVWSLGERALLLSPSDEAGSALALEQGSEHRTLAPARPMRGVDGFAIEAIAAVAAHLGIAPEKLEPADHIDLGEEGSLAVSAEVLERSRAIHARLATSGAGPAPVSVPQTTVAGGAERTAPAPAPPAAPTPPATPATAATASPHPGTPASVPPAAAPLEGRVAPASAPAPDAAEPPAPSRPAASEQGWLRRLVGWLRTKLGAR